jgi:predicted YcjX-like family ATPase
MIIFQVPSPTPEDYQTPFDPNDTDFMNTFFSNALPDSKEDASYEVKKKELYDRYVPLVVNTSRSFPHSRLDLQICN